MENTLYKPSYWADMVPLKGSWDDGDLINNHKDRMGLPWRYPPPKRAVHAHRMMDDGDSAPENSHGTLNIEIFQ